MKRSVFLLFALGCTSCFNLFLPNEGIASLPRKQNKRIVSLQKKLEYAEKEEKRAQTEIERLSQEIQMAQLSLIQKQVDDYEKRPISLSPEEIATLFLAERESLHDMIQSGFSECAFAAQVQLDRILRIITELSDSAN